MDQNIQEANQRFEKKKREELLANVPVEYHEKVNQALDWEKEEEYAKVEQICQQILEKTDIEQVKIILARIYPRLLRQDVEECNQNYHKDVQSYYEFLDQITMNDLMQEYVVETLARLCELMGSQWYRPLFQEFVEHVEKKGYLANECYKDTLESAYASIEANQYYEDGAVSLFVKNLLKTRYDQTYTIHEKQMEENKSIILVDALTNEWFLCEYYGSHKEEFAYIKENYPHSYHLVETVLQEIEAGKEEKQSKVLEQLMQYVQKGTDPEQLSKALLKSYEQTMKQNEQLQMVHTGEHTYRRVEEKIGRNDLCPCGSGKKYKHCCGKN